MNMNAILLSFHLNAFIVFVVCWFVVCSVAQELPSCEDFKFPYTPWVGLRWSVSFSWCSRTCPWHQLIPKWYNLKLLNNSPFFLVRNIYHKKNDQNTYIKIKCTCLQKLFFFLDLLLRTLPYVASGYSVCSDSNGTARAWEVGPILP